jgi:DNA gyrase subunit B
MAKETKIDTTYSEDKITYLKDIDAVRKRPGMYVGGTDLRALHHLIYEVVDNSIDEALAGYADIVEIILHSDGAVSVRDNGRGIPVGIHPKEGISTLELVMTKLHAGGKFGDGAYKVSGGLHGVGVTAVNALSKQCEVEVWSNDGAIYRQQYARGVPLGAIEKIGKTEGATGTITRFWPDEEIFPDTTFRFETLAQRFREMAFVTRQVLIRLRDERVDPFPREISFYFEGGIASFVKYLNRNRKPVHEVVYAQRAFEVENVGTIEIEVAVQYADYYSEQMMTFANTINTPDGGSHQEGLQAAITRAINYYAKKAGVLKDSDPNFSGDDTREGLTAIVSIKHPNPQFESQTKVKLMNPEVKGLVQSLVNEAFGEFLQTDTRGAKAIYDKCLISSRARLASKRARDLIRSSPLQSTTLPGKLADCSSSANPMDTELYIVEGDSAGGSAKQGRDRHFQAILPLRGKILNTERARLDKVLDNREIQALVSALGVGIGDDFDLERLRYGRIIIMTDADVDGAHIRTLLLTFFFRYMPKLVEGHHLYIAQPPLYLLKEGKRAKYAYSEDEKDRLMKSEFSEKVNLQRYKGLGEMNPDQLWDTTMDPTTRILLQVAIEDGAVADRTFDMLMGASVPPRRKFIQTHAKQVRNLDV